MTTKTEMGVELRRRTYQYGPGVYRTLKGTKREAVLEAAKLSHHYETEGVEFSVGDKLPSGEWPIMVDAVPLLPHNQALRGSDAGPGHRGENKAPELARRVERWGVVLVRLFQDRSTATSAAHRENKDRSEDLRGLGRYRSRRIGADESRRRYGVFFHQGPADE